MGGLGYIQEIFNLVFCGLFLDFFVLLLGQLVAEELEDGPTSTQG